MSNKIFSTPAHLSSFLSSVELRKKVLENKTEDLNEEQQKEVKQVSDFFGVEDLNSEIKLNLTVESFLWALFEKLDVPESPLRLKAHERLLQDIAAELDRTMGTEELPKIADEKLKKVVKFVEDPEEFKTIEVGFEFSTDEKKKTIPLPAVNVLKSDSFVSLLDDIFKNVTSLEG